MKTTVRKAYSLWVGHRGTTPLNEITRHFYFLVTFIFVNGPQNVESLGKSNGRGRVLVGFFSRAVFHLWGINKLFTDSLIYSFKYYILINRVKYLYHCFPVQSLYWEKVKENTLILSLSPDSGYSMCDITIGESLKLEHYLQTPTYTIPGSSPTTVLCTEWV